MATGLMLAGFSWAVPRTAPVPRPPSGEPHKFPPLGHAMGAGSAARRGSERPGWWPLR